MKGTIATHVRPAPGMLILALCRSSIVLAYGKVCTVTAADAHQSLNAVCHAALPKCGASGSWMIGAVLCADSTALNAAVIWDVYPTAFTSLSGPCVEPEAMRAPTSLDSRSAAESAFAGAAVKDDDVCALRA